MWPPTMAISRPKAALWMESTMALKFSSLVSGGRVPKITYETGAVGKEPVSVLLGRDPIEVAVEVCKIARLYHAGYKP